MVSGMAHSLLAHPGVDIDVEHETIVNRRLLDGGAVTEGDAAGVRRPQPPPRVSPLPARPPRHPLAYGFGYSASVIRGEYRKQAASGSYHHQRIHKRIVLAASATQGEGSAAVLHHQYYLNAANESDRTGSTDAPERNTLTDQVDQVVVDAEVKTSSETVRRLPSSGAAQPLLIAPAPRTNQYYYKLVSPSSSPGEEDTAGLTPSPDEHSREVSSGNAATATALAWEASDSAGRVQLSRSPSATQAEATRRCSGGGNGADVFERLAGVGETAAAAFGQRIRRWAEGAGLVLRPCDTAWYTLREYATHPLRYERLWRRLCAKSRYKLILLARAKIRTSTAAKLMDDDATRPLHPDNATEKSNYVDPKSSKMSNRHSFSKGVRKPLPSATPGGLSAYRRQHQYTRWCHWQLWHFFEQGSAYLTSVWRFSPWQSRCPPSGVSQGSLRIPISSVNPAGLPLSIIFNGKYVVPSSADIDDTQEGFRAEKRKVGALLRLLLAEHRPLPAKPAIPASRTSRRLSRPSASAEDVDGGTGGGSEASDAQHSSDDDVYASINESRRTSEATAAMNSYLEVRVNDETGLMHLSLYVNAGGGGDGGGYVGNCIAGCIDNHRWVVVKGLWLDHVLFFSFHPATPHTEAAVTARGEGHSNQPPRYDEEAEVLWSRCGQRVDGLVIRGVAFLKAVNVDASTTPPHTFACARCGYKRLRHNEVYVSKRTHQLARGVYFCPLCRARTPHVRLPPMDPQSLNSLLPPEVVQTDGGSHRRSSEGEKDVSPPPLSASVRDHSSSRLTYSRRSEAGGHPPVVSNQVAAAVTEAVFDCTRAAAAAPRPAWRLTHKINREEYVDMNRSLHHPPPRPMM